MVYYLNIFGTYLACRLHSCKHSLVQICFNMDLVLSQSKNLYCHKDGWLFTIICVCAFMRAYAYCWCSCLLSLWSRKS